MTSPWRDSPDSPPTLRMPESGAKGSILVADDEASVRETVAEVLRDEAYQVTAVADGSAAISSKRARYRMQSLSLSNPTTFPPSTTGRQPIFFTSISSTASRIDASGAIVVTARVMASLTSIFASHSCSAARRRCSMEEMLARKRSR